MMALRDRCAAFARGVLLDYDLSVEERRQEVEQLTQALLDVVTTCLENHDHLRREKGRATWTRER